MKGAIYSYGIVLTYLCHHYLFRKGNVIYIKAWKDKPPVVFTTVLENSLDPEMKVYCLGENYAGDTCGGKKKMEL